MSQSNIFQLEAIPWVDESAESNPAPMAMREEALRKGARRKRLARGECGYFSQYSVMPPGFEVSPHSHSHDELFIVLSGSCTLMGGEGDGIELVARDSAALAAGREYGFRVGAQGIEFIVVRPGEARSDFR